MNKNETSGENIEGRIKFVYAAFPLSKRKQVSVILPSEVRRTKNLRHRVTGGLMTLMNAEAHRI